MRIFFRSILLLSLLGSSLSAQESLALWPEGTPGIQTGAKPNYLQGGRINTVLDPQLLVYLPATNRASGTAVIICPGGSYTLLAAHHEGTQVAEAFSQAGIAAFVLQYRLPNTEEASYRHPVPLSDLQRAIALLRQNTEKWNLNPDRIGVLGFSAGGHLASTSGSFAKPVLPGDPLMDQQNYRPDFLLLIYPVINLLDPEITHKGSRNNLLGPNPPDDLCRRLSADLAADADYPPTFLAPSKNDKGVPPDHSIRLHEALKKQQIASHLLLYKEGAHGYGLGRPGKDCAGWPREALKWMLENNFYTPPAQPAGP